MITDESTKSIIKFLSCIFILFFVLLIIVKLFSKEENIPLLNEEKSNTSLIEYNDDLTSIHVEYPRFDSDEVNGIITNILYSYIKDFKTNQNNKVLDMTYELYNYKDFVNITFHIENTLNNIKNKNILIDIKNNKLSYISSLFDPEYLKNEINNKVFYKYSEYIYNKIKDENINNYTYLLDDDKMTVYFNNIKFNDIEYIPYIVIPFEDDVIYITDNNDNDKYIAFTFDDGPSEYTSDLLRTLESNNSSATFFMLGNRMKLNNEVILDIQASNSEVGSHSYSHKDLTTLEDNDLLEELNSTEIIYNEITGNKLNLLRPPYGKYNEKVTNQNYKLILWSIDPKDWLVRDSDIIYNNVMKNACDGCIVLMHDTYPETIEAVKTLIPALNEKGYSVVSVSKLMEIKGYNYTEPTDLIK